MTLSQSLVGTWRGCAFPTQESALVLCPDRTGFLFFYWGSIGAPVLDEFAWSAGDRELSITWTVRHDFPEDGSLNLDVSSDKAEVVPYEILLGPPRALRIEVGLHAGFDTPLEYVGGAGESTGERWRWQGFTRGFDPFNPGRRVWAVDGRGRWHSLGHPSVEG